MKLLAAGVIALVAAAFFAATEIRLHLALRGPGSNPDHPSIAMLGDSHVAFVNWRLLMGCDSIASYGIGGDTSTQILARLPEVLNKHPKLVILMAGTNDARRYVPSEETKANLESLRRLTVERGIEFVSLTPPPLPSRDDRIKVAISAASTRIPFSESDLLPDQVHLRASGYAKWRDTMAPIVKRYCGFSSLNSFKPL